MAERLSDAAKDWSLAASVHMRLKEMNQLKNQYFIADPARELQREIDESIIAQMCASGGYSYKRDIEKVGKIEIFDREDHEVAFYYQRDKHSPILVTINDKMEIDLDDLTESAVHRLKPGEAMHFILELIKQVCEKHGAGLKGEISMLGAISDALQEKQLIIMQEAIINQLQNEGG